MMGVYSKMSQSKVQGSLGGSGRAVQAESKADLASQGKEMKVGLGMGHAQAARRGNMLSRATRVKVWEERIEEEVQQEVESLRVQHQQLAASSGIKVAKVRGSMQMRGHGGGSKTKANAEEIGVFDAERYFAAAEQPAGWAREEEDELMEGEAGGDLPLSPLVEFGKGQFWRWRSDGVAPSCHVDSRGAGPWAAAPTGSSLGRRRVESSEFTSPRTSNASSISEVEPAQRCIAHTLLNTSSAPPHAAAGKQAKNKVQPASPSGRLANFLAKFKPPTPRKSPAPSPCTLHPPMSASTPPPPPPRPRTPAAASSVLSPARKLFPHYSPGLHPLSAAQAKASSSPRGRFLRAFSSSSAENPPCASALRYHSTLNAASTPASMPAASSPVSPAARSAPDPYSPIAHHSASTTPNSSRLPRSSAHSANYPLGSKSNSTTSITRADSAAIGHCNSSSGSFKQLPFLSRKLKVYLMPDKAAHSGKHEKSPAGMKTAAQGHEFNGVAGQYARHTQEVQVSAKQRRLRWLRAEDQVVDEDIELAERLLRVVQDHQSIGMRQHSKFSLLNQAINGSGHIINKSSANGNVNTKSLYVDGVSEYSSRKYDQMHPSSCKISVASNLVPHAAAQYSGNGAAGPHLQSFMSNPDLQLPAAAKLEREAASQQQHYDSDSSSDLFEIETTLASSVGMGLYSRRDLPVYEAKEAPFPGHSSFSFAKPGAC